MPDGEPAFTRDFRVRGEGNGMTPKTPRQYGVHFYRIFGLSDFQEMLHFAQHDSSVANVPVEVRKPRPMDLDQDLCQTANRFLSTFVPESGRRAARLEDDNYRIGRPMVPSAGRSCRPRPPRESQCRFQSR